MNANAVPEKQEVYLRVFEPIDLMCCELTRQRTALGRMTIACTNQVRFRCADLYSCPVYK
jgi:hypothetical protein